MSDARRAAKRTTASVAAAVHPYGMGGAGNPPPPGSDTAIADARNRRRSQLRTALPGAVDLLRRRRADLIAADDIDAYVTLHWLEWHGGSLRLTITGRNICAQQAPLVAA